MAISFHALSTSAWTFHFSIPCKYLFNYMLYLFYSTHLNWNSLPISPNPHPVPLVTSNLFSISISLYLFLMYVCMDLVSIWEIIEPFSFFSQLSILPSKFLCSMLSHIVSICSLLHNKNMVLKIIFYLYS